MLRLKDICGWLRSHVLLVWLEGALGNPNSGVACRCQVETHWPLALGQSQALSLVSPIPHCVTGELPFLLPAEFYNFYQSENDHRTCDSSSNSLNLSRVVKSRVMTLDGSFFRGLSGTCFILNSLTALGPNHTPVKMQLLESSEFEPQSRVRP